MFRDDFAAEPSCGSCDVAHPVADYGPFVRCASDGKSAVERGWAAKGRVEPDHDSPMGGLDVFEGATEHEPAVVHHGELIGDALDFFEQV